VPFRCPKGVGNGCRTRRPFPTPYIIWVFCGFVFLLTFFRGEASDFGCHSGALRLLEMGVGPDAYVQHPISFGFFVDFFFF
jgi:hypothetical protein